ncbi:MAG: small subunit ribosomal protein S5 [Candidatus Paceibacteria bacterium]|jgi:small subunit ribosomal protein S5
MSEDKTQETNEAIEAPVVETPVEKTEVPVSDVKTDDKAAASTDKAEEATPEKRKFIPRKTPFKGGARPPRKTFDRPKPEFDQKIINIRRVVRVMAGGRRFSFSVAMLLGDKKGRIAIGVGKSPDTALAIQKAIKDGKKNMIKVGLTEEMSIAHEVKTKYSSSSLSIFPNKGKGLVAGSAVRDMLNLAGIKDVTAKITTRSKNKINIARAVVQALMELPGSQKVTVSLVEEKKPERRRTFTRKTDSK